MDIIDTENYVNNYIINILEHSDKLWNKYREYDIFDMDKLLVYPDSNDWNYICNIFEKKHPEKSIPNIFSILREKKNIKVNAIYTDDSNPYDIFVIEEILFYSFIVK